MGVAAAGMRSRGRQGRQGCQLCIYGSLGSHERGERPQAILRPLGARGLLNRVSAHGRRLQIGHQVRVRVRIVGS